MPDDERSRRRLGDATRSRIADLASGWSVDAPSSEPPPVDPEPVASAPEPSRSKPKTNPPPPPGSAERKALDDKIVATTSRGDAPTVIPTGEPARPKAITGPHVVARSKTATGSQPAVDAGSGRTKAPSVPPPPPGSPERAAHERSKPASIPPPVPSRTKPPTAPPKPSGPKYPRAGYDGPASPLSTQSERDEKPFTSEQRTPAVIIDTEAFAGNALPAKAGELVTRPTVPTGEFEGPLDTMAQKTTRRDPGLDAVTPPPDLVIVSEDDDDDDDDRSARRGDPTTVDPSTAKFERGDPTSENVAGADETEVRPMRTKHLTSGTLRRTAALRRKRGLYGDVRYVFTALMGVRRARRELGELEHRQQVRETSRRRHLITLGRAAATMDDFTHPALGKSRDALAAIEDERAKHAGAVAASDAELERVRRDRAANQKAYAESKSKVEAELAELAKKLEPLEKDADKAKKKAADLRDELHRIEKKITDTESLLVSVKAEKLDKAAIQADIATYKANKQAVLRDEPVIAAELDALNPRIAALDAQRAELQKKQADADKAEADDQRRTLELLEAIGAKRKVVERAATEAETARDNALFELGERLYHDRPRQLTPQLSPIDRIDLEIGEDERRSMELREILSNIDKAKLTRGIGMIILALGAAGSIAYLILTATQS